MPFATNLFGFGYRAWEEQANDLEFSSLENKWIRHHYSRLRQFDLWFWTIKFAQLHYLFTFIGFIYPCFMPTGTCMAADISLPFETFSLLRELDMDRSRNKVKNRWLEPKVRELQLAEYLRARGLLERVRDPSFVLALILTDYVTLDKPCLLSPFSVKWRGWKGFPKSLPIVIFCKPSFMTTTREVRWGNYTSWRNCWVALGMWPPTLKVKPLSLPCSKCPWHVNRSVMWQLLGTVPHRHLVWVFLASSCLLEFGKMAGTQAATLRQWGRRTC